MSAKTLLKNGAIKLWTLWEKDLLFSEIVPEFTLKQGMTFIFVPNFCTNLTLYFKGQEYWSECDPISFLSYFDLTLKF